MFIRTAMSLLVVGMSLSACTITAGKDAGSGAAPNSPPQSPAEQAARDNKSGPDMVAWANVPSDFNPDIKTSTFSVVGIQKIELSIFSSGNVQVNYLPNLDPAAATIKSFTVHKNSGSFGSIELNPKGSVLEVESIGEYACSIETSNGAITKLDGLCVVHTEINLPDTAQVEVYYTT